MFAGLTGLALVAFRQVPVTGSPEVESEARFEARSEAREAPELAPVA